MGKTIDLACRQTFKFIVRNEYTFYRALGKSSRISSGHQELAHQISTVDFQFL